MHIILAFICHWVQSTDLHYATEKAIVFDEIIHFEKIVYTREMCKWQSHSVQPQLFPSLGLFLKDI